MPPHEIRLHDRELFTRLRQRDTGPEARQARVAVAANRRLALRRQRERLPHLRHQFARRKRMEQLDVRRLEAGGSTPTISYARAIQRESSGRQSSGRR